MNNADATLVDSRALRVFLALMAERSVSRAAQGLGMSQPAVSHTLARLRQVFGDPLLLRSRGGMIPTDRAQELVPQATRALAALNELMKPVHSFDPATSTRRFVVSAPEYAEHMLLPPLLVRLRAQAPSVRLDVQAPDPAHAYDMLERGEVDLRIAWLLNPMQSLRSAPLFQDQMAYIAARSHPQVRGSLTLQLLLSLPHARTFGASQSTTNRVLDDAMERMGARLERAFQLQNFLTVPSALVGTDVITALPLRLAQRFAAEYPLQILEPPMRLPRIRYAMYWHERSQSDTGHRWLRAQVAEAARQLRGAACGIR